MKIIFLKPLFLLVAIFTSMKGMSDELKPQFSINEKGDSIIQNQVGEKRSKMIFNTGKEFFTIESLTPNEQNGILVALCGKENRMVLVGIEVSSGKKLWDFYDEKIEDLGNLKWVGESLILGTFQARRGLLYALIDVKTKKVLKSGYTEFGDVEFKDGKLFEVLPDLNPSDTDPAKHEPKNKKREYKEIFDPAKNLK